MGPGPKEWNVLIFWAAEHRRCHIIWTGDSGVNNAFRSVVCEISDKLRTEENILQLLCIWMGRSLLSLPQHWLNVAVEQVWTGLNSLSVEGSFEKTVPFKWQPVLHWCWLICCTQQTGSNTFSAFFMPSVLICNKTFIYHPSYRRFILIDVLFFSFPGKHFWRSRWIDVMFFSLNNWSKELCCCWSLV